MSRVITVPQGSFEAGDFSAWDATGGSPSVVTAEAGITPVHGSYMMKVPSSAGDHYARAVFTATDLIFCRGYYHLHDFTPGSGNTCFLIRMVASTQPNLDVILRNTAGLLQLQIALYQTAGGTLTSGLYTIDTSDWLCVEAKFQRGVGNALASLYVDGQLLVDTTDATLDRQTNRIFVGGFSVDAGASGSFYCDAVEADNAALVGCFSSGMVPPPPGLLLGGFNPYL